MTAAAAPPDTSPGAPSGAPPARRSRLPLLLGLLLAVAGGAGGFGVVRLGLLGGAEAAGAARAEGGYGAPPAMAFVPLPPMVVNLPGEGDRFLRFSAQLEVAPEHAEEVTTLIPRAVDVLNGFLRAVEPAELEDSAALLRMRAQMLRRVQVVAGGDRVRDLLVMEFVVN